MPTKRRKLQLRTSKKPKETEKLQERRQIRVEILRNEVIGEKAVLGDREANRKRI